MDSRQAYEILMAKVRKYEEKAHAQGIEEAAEMFYYYPKTYQEISK